MCVHTQLIGQLQWLQKADSVLKPNNNSSTTNTLRFLSDMLKEGTELANNKCMYCMLHNQLNFFIMLLVVMTETCNSLKHLIKIGKKWEQKAQEALEVE